MSYLSEWHEEGGVFVQFYKTYKGEMGVNLMGDSTIPWTLIEKMIAEFAKCAVEERNARVQKLLKEIKDERDEI